jgi:hypothetical protein
MSVDFDSLVADPFTYIRNKQAMDQQAAAEQDAANKSAIAQPMGPQEQDGLLKQMLGAGASGLGFVGGTLGKLFGGRAIRAGLQGLTGGPMNWRELASVIPGSDITGLTDPEQTVTGRNLLDQWGMTSPTTQDQRGTFQLSDLAGPAVEAALDPATYLAFGAGASTKAGQAAERLGVLPKTTAARIAGYTAPEQIAAKMGMTPAAAAAKAAEVGVDLKSLVGKPLGGLVGLKLPFTTAADSGAILGTGPWAQKAAETIGTPFKWLGSTRAADYARAMFNPEAQGQPYASTQAELIAQAPYTRTAGENLRRGIGEAYDPLLDFRAAGTLPPEYAPMVRGAAEGFGVPGPQLEGVSDAIAQAAAQASALKDAARQRFESAGGQISSWGSVFPDVQHFPRSPTPLEVQSPIFRGSGPTENLGKQFYAGVPNAIQRKDILDLPGGTAQVNELVRNPAIGTSARTIGAAPGSPLDKLMNVPGHADAITAKLQAAMGAFAPADQLQMQALMAADKAGSLAPADAVILDGLRKQYLASRAAMMGTIREDVLGMKPVDVTQLLALRKAPGPLTAADAARLAELEGMEANARMIGGRMSRMYAERATGTLGDPAADIIPGVSRSLQDRAAEEYLRSQVFQLDPQRLAELTNEAGLDPGSVAAWASSKPSERAATLQGLQMPGKSGVGNLISETGRILTPAEAQELLSSGHLDRIARPLAKYLGQLDPQRQTRGLFSNDPFSDLLRYGESMVKGTEKADVVTNVLGRNAAFGGAGNVKLQPLLKELKLNTPVAQARIMEQMNAAGGLPGGVAGKLGDIGKARVSPQIAEAIQALNPRTKMPEYIKPTLAAIDQATGATRAALTYPWPSFHVRNLVTDEVNSLMRVGPGGIKWGPTAQALSQGKNPEALLSLPMIQRLGITDPAEAARVVGREAFATQAFGRGQGRLTTEGMQSAERGILPAIPGAIPSASLADIGSGKVLPKDWSFNPARTEGILGQTETKFAPGVLGRTAADWEDTTARGGLFLHLLEQDYTPAAARAIVDKTVYGGAQFTPFEKGFVRRLMPFYGYTKYVIPQQLTNIANYPGGLAAQGIRMANAQRDQAGYLPEYLAGGLAIPIGQQEDGTQRYLSKLDMPWEMPFNMVKPGGNVSSTITGTGMGLLGQMNPLLKGALEVATNRQFYTGRDLDTLQRTLTGVPAIDNLFYNSPAARVLTTGGTLADVRKDVPTKLLGLTTGVKLTDVDMNRERAFGTLAAVKDYLAHDPNAAQHVNYTPAKGQELTPQEVQVFQLLKQLQAQATHAAAAAKKGG